MDSSKGRKLCKFIQDEELFADCPNVVRSWILRIFSVVKRTVKLYMTRSVYINGSSKPVFGISDLQLGQLRLFRIHLYTKQCIYIIIIYI
jgi:hypothetical protein